jgi:hypothetical protein
MICPDNFKVKRIHPPDGQTAVSGNQASAGGAPRTSNRYMAGITIRLSKVDETSPPMITQASGA